MKGSRACFSVGGGRPGKRPKPWTTESARGLETREPAVIWQKQKATSAKNNFAGKRERRTATKKPSAYGKGEPETKAKFTLAKSRPNKVGKKKVSNPLQTEKIEGGGEKKKNTHTSYLSGKGTDPGVCRNPKGKRKKEVNPTAEEIDVRMEPTRTKKRN